jgi:hypothetical protein
MDGDTERKSVGVREESGAGGKKEETKEEEVGPDVQGGGALLPFCLGSGHLVSKSGYRLFQQACPEQFACCICFELFRIGQRIAFHPVTARPDRIHVFHFECITHWIWRGSHEVGAAGWSTNGCPVCLYPFLATSSMSDIRRARTNVRRAARRISDRETRDRVEKSAPQKRL